MAVAFDAVGPSSAGVSSLSSTNLSWTHTVGTGPATILVSCALDSAISNQTMTATCDGTSMSSLGTIATSGSAACYLQVWKIDAQGAGAHAIVITASGTPTDLTGGSISFTGVDSLGTPVTAQAATVNLPNGTADNIIASFFGAGNNVTGYSTGTSRFNKNLGGAYNNLGNIGGGTQTATAGTNTITWTTSASGNSQAIFAVEVKAPGGTESSAGYSSTATILSGGTGSWANKDYANGAPNAQNAVWTSA
jgi:hypothetical protein